VQFGCLSEVAIPEAILIEPDRLDLALRDTITLEVQFTGGGDERARDAVHWTTHDTRVVSVDDAGRVEARAVGSTTVNAEFGGVSGEVTVTVGIDILNIAAAYSHSCAIDHDRRVACWGANGWAQLGDGTLFSGAAAARTVDTVAVDQLALGLSYGCALLPDGRAICWGGNFAGQLGRGAADDLSNAAAAVVGGGRRFRTLDAGVSHTCGLTDAGEIYCWGSNLNGQLGTVDGIEFCSFTAEPCTPNPVPVSTALAWSTFATGDEHTCAVSDGMAYCWGFNSAGQLGDSTITPRVLPTPVYGSIEFASLSAGAEHTCGLTPDGQAYCWGRNAGRLGNGSQLPSTIPVAVAGGHRFLSIHAAGVHTCGLDDAATVWCWGSNGQGQIGVPSREVFDEPVPVSLGAPATSVVTGFLYTCAMTADGTAYCWGSNTSGQLGRGASGGTSAVPLPVAGQN
jgi:alpha-tubulin suppressor-like RCC1 family protein